MILRHNFELLHEYRKELKETHKVNALTLETYEAYESLILDWAGNKALNKAPLFKETFPEYLNNCTGPKGKPYSSEYIKGACGYARRFFDWARDNDKDFKPMKGAWIKTITPIKRPGKLQDASYYTREELEKICAVRPTNLRMQRMIAAIAFLLLSAMRISAFLTLPIKNVFITAKTIKQTPEDGVCTKGNKAAVTSLLRISSLLKIVKDWDALVREKCPENSSWYARLDHKGEFDPRIIEPMTTENADYLKKKARNYRSLFYKDLKDLCDLAGVDYKPPHKARHGHIHLGMRKAKNYEERKAVSMNAMHETITITDAIYSRMKSEEANEIIANFDFDEETDHLVNPKSNSGSENRDPETIRYLISILQNELDHSKS